MKIPGEAQIQLVSFTRRLRHPAWILIAGILFLSIPGTFAKLVACCLGLTTLLMQPRDRRWQLGWLWLLMLAYAATFLLTPIATYLTDGGLAGGGNALPYEVGLVAVGIIWLIAASRLDPPAPSPRPAASLLPVFAIAWLLIFWLLVLPGYGASPPYQGDEVYHIMSAQLYRLHLQVLLLQPWPGLAWALWLLVALVALWHKPDRATLWVMAISGLLLALISAATTYPLALLQHDLAVNRAMRYPPALAWLSALMAGGTAGELGEYFYAPTGFYRLLTALSLTLLAFGLALDKRWRHRPLPAALGCAAILTIPTIHYHASLLYLDLPVVVLTTLILLDARHLLAARPAELPRHTSWWLLVVLGLLKESAAPILAVILIGRWLYQARDWQRLKRTVWHEAGVAVAALTPLAVYLLIRHRFGARPYGAQVMNLFDAGLWWQSLTAFWEQSGLILLAALAGLWLLWRSHRRWEAGLLLACCCGLKAFFVIDSSKYVELARFNLYLLPPIIVLGWEAYTALHGKRRALAWLGAALIIAFNLWTSPVQLNGQRASNWGGTEEAWYPFADALADLATERPQARLALANANADYGLNILVSQLQWAIVPGRFPNLSPDPAQNLALTLQAAEAQNLDTILFRYETHVSPPAALGTWRLLKQYQGTGGTLAVYVR